MELIRFIEENNINNFESLKNILESNSFNLKIKIDNDFPNLFLIYNQDNSNFNSKIVNECNGIILDKNTLKIVCYTFDKCSNEETIPNNINQDELYVENSYEGTLIRLYYHENKWMYSTKKCIDASKSKWLSNKNFVQLFNDCLKNFNIENFLNKNHCYSFIIMHPENKIIIDYKEPMLYHISTRNMNTLTEVVENININSPQKIFIKKNDIESFLKQILFDNNLIYEGFIFIDKNFNRWKIKTPLFNKVKNLWGNTNNRFYRYLELRKNVHQLEEYLYHFKDDRNKFIEYEYKINEFANIILTIYIDKYILKKDIKIPYYFSKIIYNLHGDYFKNKEKTDYNKIMLKLLELDPKQICFMMNHHQKYIEEQCKVKEQINIDNNKNYDDTFLDMDIV